MKAITQRGFRNNAASVMDQVEAGETFHVTRNGVEVARVSPITLRRRRSAEELVERHRGGPPPHGETALPRSCPVQTAGTPSPFREVTRSRSAASSTSTTTVSPSVSSPDSSSRANGSPIEDCTRRRSGRAP